MKRLPTLLLLCALLWTSSGVALAHVDAPTTPALTTAGSSLVTNGPYGGSILQLENDSTNPAGIYAVVTQVGLFHSADRGQIWTLLLPGTGFEGNLAIDDDPVSGMVLYASQENQGLVRSTDGGQTWTELTLAADVTNVQTVRAFTDPSQHGTVYATLSFLNQDECGDHCGIYRSTDYGDTWTWLGTSLPVDARFNALAVDPIDSDNLFAGTNDGRIYISSNAGTSWTLSDNNISRVGRLIVTSDGSSLYVIGSGAGVSLPMMKCAISSSPALSLDCTDGSDPAYVLIDPSDSGFTGYSNVVNDLKINPSNPSDLLVASGYRAARSTDGGDTWTFYENSSGPSQPTAVLYDAGQANTIYTGNTRGLWLTNQANNFAGAWSEIDDQMTGVVPSHIRVAPSDPQIIYISSNAGMFYSEDAAETWNRLNPYCENDYCFELNTPFAIDPQDPAILVQAAWEYSVHISSDGGQNWTDVTGIEEPDLDPGTDYVIDMKDLIAVPGDPTAYLAAVAFHDSDNPNFGQYAAGGIYRSLDHGQTWGLVTTIDGQALTSLAYDPTDPQRVYAGGCSLNVYSTCDYAVVYASDDRGATWSQVTPADMTLKMPWDANVIAVRPTDGRLYIADSLNLLWLDKDGSAWTQGDNSPDLNNEITQLIFDPDPQKAGWVLYAATSQGVFVSNDAGNLFTPMTNELSQTDVTAIAGARTAEGENFLFIGSAGGAFSGDNAPTFNASAADSAQLVKAGVYRQTSSGYSIFIPLVVR